MDECQALVLAGASTYGPGRHRRIQVVRLICLAIRSQAHMPSAWHVTVQMGRGTDVAMVTVTRLAAMPRDTGVTIDR